MLLLLGRPGDAPASTRLEPRNEDGQSDLLLADAKAGSKVWEFAVLMTSLDLEILSLARLYRDRGDSENPFDELKNQWDWAGFTTSDINRCQIMARLIALVCNWSTLYMRLADPNRHREGLTTRSLLLNAVGPQTRQTGAPDRPFKPREQVKSALEGIAKFFGWLKQITEQLTQPERRALILSDALRKFLRGRKLQPPCCRLETLAWIEILSSSQQLAGVNAVFRIKVTPGGLTFRRLKIRHGGLT